MVIPLNVISFFKILVCFFIFLGFGSVLSVFFPYQIEGITLFLTIALMILNKGYKINKKLIKIAIGIFIILFLSMLLTHSSLNNYKILFVRVVLIILIITAFRNQYAEIVKPIVKASWLIAILALINFVLTMAFPMKFSLMESKDGYATLSICYMFNMLAGHSIMGIYIIRNQSIFWEPGILQIVMNILIYYIAIEENKPLLRAVLPIFILITTASTTGFIIFFFILIMKFKNTFSLKGNGLLQTIGISLIVIAFIPVGYTEIIHKFKGDAKTSFTLRLFDLYAGLTIATDNPVSGVGMDREKLLMLSGKSSVKVNGETMRVERGNTNSFVLLLMKLGFPITIVLIISLYKQNIFRCRFVFFIILLFSLSSEPLYASSFVILLMTSSIKIPSLSGNKIFAKSKIIYPVYDK